MIEKNIKSVLLGEIFETILNTMNKGKHIQKEATLTFDYYISDLCFFKEGIVRNK